MSTASRPVPWAASSRRLSGAGVPATPGTTVPSASATQRHRRGGAHGVAVPPAADHRRLGPDELLLGERAGPHLLRQPPHVGAAARAATPRNVPVSIGPPGTTTAGRSTEAAAISSDGIVLSQPPSSTTPSIGLARSISSVAIAAMLRHSMAVGRTCVSPSDTTGRSSGMPPASYTPLRPRPRPRSGARCRASGPRRCWRWRSAGGREGVVRAAPAHPGPVDVGVAVRAPRTTARCEASRARPFQQLARRSILRNIMEHRQIHGGTSAPARGRRPVATVTRRVSSAPTGCSPSSRSWRAIPTASGLEELTRAIGQPQTDRAPGAGRAAPGRAGRPGRPRPLCARRRVPADGLRPPRGTPRARPHPSGTGGAGRPVRRDRALRGPRRP